MNEALLPLLLCGVGQNALFAYGRPAFLFDTTNNQYIANGTGVMPNPANMPGWSFTRASAGYAPNSAGVLQLFGSGVPRITDRGLLIEGARTNLCLRSQEFDNASWTKTGVGTGVAPTVTANAGVAPDGTTTADRVQFSLGGGTGSTDISRLDQTITVANATAHRNTVYIKSNTASTYVMELDISGGTARTVITVTPEWQRFESPFTSTSTSMQVRIGLRGAGATQNSDTADVLVWGAQLEAAAFPSSYIPTTSASVTRPADVCSIAVSGISYPCTLFAEFERVVDTGGNEAFIQIANTGNEQSSISVNGSTDKMRTTVSTGGVTQADIASAASVAIGTVYRGAPRVATNDINQALSGTLGTQDTSATTPTAPNQIILGSNKTPTPCFGFIRRAAVYSNNAFTDGELEDVTT